MRLFSPKWIKIEVKKTLKFYFYLITLFILQTHYTSFCRHDTFCMLTFYFARVVLKGHSVVPSCHALLHLKISLNQSNCLFPPNPYEGTRACICCTVATVNYQDVMTSLSQMREECRQTIGFVLCIVTVHGAL